MFCLSALSLFQLSAKSWACVRWDTQGHTSHKPHIMQPYEGVSSALEYVTAIKNLSIITTLSLSLLAVPIMPIMFYFYDILYNL